MASKAWRRVGAGVLFLWMAFAAVPASAERLPPNPLSGGWQVMSSDGSWVSSRCLGESIFAQCYAETLLACHLFTAHGHNTRSFEDRHADPSWIGGFHPVCDSLRREPGNPYENGFYLDFHIYGPGELLFYKFIPIAAHKDIMAPQPYAGYIEQIQPGDTILIPLFVKCVPPPQCDLAAEATKPLGSGFRPLCLQDCEETKKVQALVVREYSAQDWGYLTYYAYYRDNTWPYLHGFFEGLWYDNDHR